VRRLHQLCRLHQLHRQKKHDDYYSKFKGDFELPVPRTDLTEKGNQLFALTLDPKTPVHAAFLSKVDTWLGSLPTYVHKGDVEIVSNPLRFRIFLGSLETVEKRQHQGAFQSTLDEEVSPEERKAVIARLEEKAKLTVHNRSVKILRVWHGTNGKVLPSILEDGFAAIATLDEGWFGKGIYFTTHARYALRYCRNPKCLLLCYVLLLNPFPVVADDAKLDQQPSDFRFYAKGNYKNYQCHYVPVAPAEPEPTIDFRPPQSGSTNMYDEVVIFQEAYILPQVVVHLT